MKSKTVPSDEVVAVNNHDPNCDIDPHEDECTWCDQGWADNDDPMWNGFDVEFVRCSACSGTGLMCRQRIF